MIEILDMFASNGSTWFDKDFFKSSEVHKNDIRDGIYKVQNQKIEINPDYRLDMFDIQLTDEKFAIVYADPPHLKFNTTGLMSDKYTTLPNDYKTGLKNMFINAAIRSDILVLKWCDIHIPLNEVLEIAKQFYKIGFGNTRKSKNIKNSTYFITMFKKPNNNYYEDL